MLVCGRALVSSYVVACICVCACTYASHGMKSSNDVTFPVTVQLSTSQPSHLPPLPPPRVRK